MSDIEPAKLKVVELRAELSARGLDTKGNKAVLVKRLEDAIKLDDDEGNEESTGEESEGKSEDGSQESIETRTNHQPIEDEEEENEPVTVIPKEHSPIEKVLSDSFIQVVDSESVTVSDVRIADSKEVFGLSPKVGPVTSCATVKDSQTLQKDSAPITLREAAFQKEGTITPEKNVAELDTSLKEEISITSQKKAEALQSQIKPSIPQKDKTTTPQREPETLKSEAPLKEKIPEIPQEPETLQKEATPFTLQKECKSPTPLQKAIPETHHKESGSVIPKKEAPPVIPEKEVIQPVIAQKVVQPVTPQKEVKLVTPQKEVKLVNLQKEIQPVTSQKEVKLVNLQKEIQPVTPQKEVKLATPQKEIQAVTPQKEVKPVTPQKVVQPASPQKEGTPVTPQKEGTPVTPQKEGKPVTPQKEGKPVTPQKEGKPVTPQKEGKPVTPQKEDQLLTLEKEGKSETSQKEPVTEGNPESSQVEVNIETLLKERTTETLLSSLTPPFQIDRKPEGTASKENTPIISEGPKPQENDVELVDITEETPKQTTTSTEKNKETSGDTKSSESVKMENFDVKSESGRVRNRDSRASRWSPQIKTEPMEFKQEFDSKNDLPYLRRSSSRSPVKEKPFTFDNKSDASFWIKEEEKAKEPSLDDLKVVLDTYNSDLNLTLDPSGYSATPLTKEGFAFVWAGARASYGIKSGKACFEVKILEQLDVSHLPDDEMNPHVVRVGFSCEHTSMQLGEEPMSWGFGGTGKASTNCKFRDYGVPFAQGDVVTAFLNMDCKPVELSFAVNGRHLGSAYKIPATELRDMALYPHVLTKNCQFEVNFGQLDEPYFPLPPGYQDYALVGRIPLDQMERGTVAPKKRSDCEMLMMCGLPGCGKTTWADDYCQKHPEKKFNVLGTNSIIDKMKVMGLPRKRNYSGRWEVLIQMSTKCLNTLFSIGARKFRNYILDQTNVYPSAQRRKMSSFAGFRRLAIVIVPTDEEFLRRVQKRVKEEGTDIPESAVMEMKANFGLPYVGDLFDEVIYTELQRDESEVLVKQYNAEGQTQFPPNKRFRPNDSGRGGQSFSPRGGSGDRDRFSGGGDRGRFDGDRGRFGSGNDRGRGGGERGRFRGGDRGRGFGGRGGDRGRFGGDRDRFGSGERDRFGGDRDRDRSRSRDGRDSRDGYGHRGGGGGDYPRGGPRGGRGDWQPRGSPFRGGRGGSWGGEREDGGRDRSWSPGGRGGSREGTWSPGGRGGNRDGDWSPGGGRGGGGFRDSQRGGFGGRGGDRGFRGGGRGDRGSRGGGRGGDRGGGFNGRGSQDSNGGSRPYQPQQQYSQPQAQQQWGQQAYNSTNSSSSTTNNNSSAGVQSYVYGQGYNQQSYGGGYNQQSYSQTAAPQQQTGQQPSYDQTQYTTTQYTQQPYTQAAQATSQTTSAATTATATQRPQQDQWSHQAYQQPAAYQAATAGAQVPQQQSYAGQYDYSQQQQSYYGQQK